MADAHFCRLVVKPILMPLSIETLLNQVENSQLTIMFDYAGYLERTVRDNSSGKLNSFGIAMQKYPPIYWQDLNETMDLYELLTTREILYWGAHKSYQCSAFAMNV